MSDMTRRTFLGVLGLGLGGLVACDTEQRDGPLVRDLPYNEEVPHSLPRDFVQQQEKRVVVPPPPPPSDYIRTEVGEIYPRAAWTRAAPNLYRVEPMQGVSRVVFHHSGDGKPLLVETYQDVARHLEIVREYHRNRGFSDIGYHFAIDRTGRIWQLRSLLYEGQHVHPAHNVRWNAHSIGVVLLGDFNKQKPTDAQKNRAVAFGAFLRRKYQVAAKSVHTHMELNQTDCPGRGLQPFMVEARKRGLI